MLHVCPRRYTTFEPDGFFRVIFSRSPDLAMKEAMPGAADTGKRVEVKTTQRTTQKTTQRTTQKIIALIRQNPEITRQELAMELGITEDGIKYHLKKMLDRGLLRRVGPDKGGYWEVIEASI